jgi:hypothetical protein
MPAKILALGDSWFHYPNKINRDGVPVLNKSGVGNILYYLHENYNLPFDYYEREINEIVDALSGKLIDPVGDTFGRCGEELLLMVYGFSRHAPGNKVYDITWLDMLVDRIEKYKSDTDTFLILLSGGGNDIVNTNLRDFLNNIGSPDPVNQNAINNAINNDLKGAYAILMARICNQFPDKTFHFIVHGYACPIVSGRGLFGILQGFWEQWLHKMPVGPWLQPFFEEKHIRRPQSDAIIGDFINRFNTMLSQLTCVSMKNNGTLHYIDMRSVPDPANEDASWCNELHLDRNYFIKAADAYNQVIASLLKPKP